MKRTMQKKSEIVDPDELQGMDERNAGWVKAWKKEVKKCPNADHCDHYGVDFIACNGGEGYFGNIICLTYQNSLRRKNHASK